MDIFWKVLIIIGVLYFVFLTGTAFLFHWGMKIQEKEWRREMTEKDPLLQLLQDKKE